MQLSRKHIIIAAAVAVLIVITIVLLVLMLKPASKSAEPPEPPKPVGPVKQGIFTRCDEIDEPIDEISIRSCRDDSDLLGYCKVPRNDDVILTASFTPGKFELSEASQLYSSECSNSRAALYIGFRVNLILDCHLILMTIISFSSDCSLNLIN